MNLSDYDKKIVFFSGGKDSTACVLWLLDMGVPAIDIELWHHDIDGAGEPFMDWGVTPDYCRAFAAAMGIPLYFSYRVGGFKGEMLRKNSLTGNVRYETPTGWVERATTRGKKSTRRKFPQVGASLTTRWCTANEKIDPSRIAINGQPRFHNSKTLLVSGERAEESAARAKYKDFETERACDNRNGRHKRHVDRWRPVHGWSEAEVWGIIEKYNIIAHPCYYAGFGRCSCQFCIFGNANQFKSAKTVSPDKFQCLCDYEKEFGCTLKRDRSLPQLISTGKPYPTTWKYIDELNSKVYRGEIFTEKWELPAGAYGESTGPS